MPDDNKQLIERVVGVAHRIAATPVQVEDANTVLQAADLIESLERESRAVCKECGAGVPLSECPHPPQTWKERAEENARAAGERRKEAKDFKRQAKRDAAVLEALTKLAEEFEDEAAAIEQERKRKAEDAKPGVYHRYL